MRRKSQQKYWRKKKNLISHFDLRRKISPFVRLLPSPTNLSLFFCTYACQNMMKDWHEWLWHDIWHCKLETHSAVTDMLLLGVNCCNLCCASQRVEEKLPPAKGIFFQKKQSNSYILRYRFYVYPANCAYWKFTFNIIQNVTVK